MGVLNAQQSRTKKGDRPGLGPAAGRPDRLFAALSPAPVWSRRVRALLAAGVLVVSAGGTATSVASEPDDQQEGVVAPDLGGSPPGGQTGVPVDEQTGPGVGGETVLPYEVEPVLSGPGGDVPEGQSDDAAPIEVTPIEDPDAPSLLTAPEAVGPGTPSDLPAPPPDALPPAEPVPTAPLTPPTAPPPDTDDQAEPKQSPPQGNRQQETGRPERAERRAGKHGASKRRAEQGAGKPGASHRGATKQPAAAPPATEGAGGELSAGTSPARATPNRTAHLRHQRFHVVQPGESLWSIASALLGQPASPAAIAREVRRLWRLNRARIGTGDPSLLPAGVRLRLR